MPFGMGIGSDHRCMWLYIRTRVLMGHELEQSRNFAARQLKCDDPRVRNKYINHYEQYIEKTQLRERSRKLASNAKERGITQQQAQEYEQLDTLRKKGVYEAQQQCRKFRTGEKDWSPKTTLLGIRVLFWKLACNRAYGSKVQRWYHARLRKQALLQTAAIPDTDAGIVTKLKQAMSQWRKYSKAEAAEDRKTFLQKKATAITEEKNTTMENIMKHLRLRESQKRSDTEIKMVRGKLRSGGVSRVTYLDENGVVHESTGRENLEDLCNKVNEEKLQQTASTNFTTGALQEDVGWVGIGPAVCMMFDRTYEPPEEVDEYTKKLIKQFWQNRKATEHDPL
jgi:hypothetical protein